MIATVDTKQGMATDHFELWDDRDDGSSNPVPVSKGTVDISLASEDELLLEWNQGKRHMSFYLPIERIKRLLQST